MILSPKLVAFENSLHGDLSIIEKRLCMLRYFSPEIYLKNMIIKITENYNLHDHYYRYRYV